MMHYNQTHSDEMQICSECDMLITNARQMPYHFKTKHPMVTLPLFLKSPRSFGYSIELFDLFNKKKCKICKQKFRSIIESQRHFIDEHDMKFELCSVCITGFRTESQLHAHWRQKHDDLKFIEFKAPALASAVPVAVASPSPSEPAPTPMEVRFT